VQTGSHGADIGMADIGNVLIRKTLEIVHDQDELLWLGQVVEAILYYLALLIDVEHLRWVGTIICKLADRPAGIGAEIILWSSLWIKGYQVGLASALLGPEHVHRYIVGDAKEPGRERSTCFELVEVLMHFDKGILHHFFGLVTIAQYTVCGGIHSSLVALYQDLEKAQVAIGSKFLDDVLVVRMRT